MSQRLPEAERDVLHDVDGAPRGRQQRGQRQRTPQRLSAHDDARRSRRALLYRRAAPHRVARGSKVKTKKKMFFFQFRQTLISTTDSENLN